MEEAYEWHLTLEDGAVSAEQQSAFEAWISRSPKHENAYAEAAATWQEFGRLNRDHLAADVSASTQSKAFEGSPRHVGYGRHALAAAAVVLVAVLLVIVRWPLENAKERLSNSAQASYETGIGETKLITLSDGSTAALSAGTSLHARLSEDHRALELVQGAAVFNVAKDPERPFSITAGSVQATALGTVFEVRNNGGLVRVAVQEGRVQYTTSMMIGGQKSDLVNQRELGPGEFGKTLGGSATDHFGSFDTASFAAWRQARLDYEGATLMELVADANRYSDTPIVLRGTEAKLEAMTVSAYFDSNDIQSMLVALPQLFPVAVDDSDPSQIVILIE
ncbi:MAG: FecR domain-containing protein [Pseudomonadota bacterium]